MCVFTEQTQGSGVRPATNQESQNFIEKIKNKSADRKTQNNTKVGALRE